ncbi:MAG: hypothetical protein Kow0042_31270 [Calditrichia bacterium]
MRKNAQKILDMLKKDADKRKIEFNSLIREGSIVDVIIETVNLTKSDLLVMGAHGKTGASRGFLGSTAQALSISSPCSLLLVRA